MDHLEFTNSLGLIDLVSEQHKRLRQAVMQKIEAIFADSFSQMDVYLISLVNHRPMSVSEAARYMNVSRQAAHKQVKRLSELGYIELGSSEKNRRDKIIVLTQTGRKASAKINQVKQDMESQLIASIGETDYERAKALFQKPWEL
ncbi:MarR family transcriptional regulator [Alginatibacterium sediminis]|uniref:MarR family transcriptional regulator n=1 Tax=Alginatibacterium sediminis TaxID=2164068 RepID=A0A420EI16_9ALTE|nr:MarR family transcriptional regulator [Alginatibacterium sediminis]RKF20339.1 MarR family transcriptional regulator [Alginatibacterium sediminis]